MFLGFVAKHRNLNFLNMGVFLLRLPHQYHDNLEEDDQCWTYTICPGPSRALCRDTEMVWMTMNSNCYNSMRNLRVRNPSRCLIPHALETYCLFSCTNQNQLSKLRKKLLGSLSQCFLIIGVRYPRNSITPERQ